MRKHLTSSCNSTGTVILWGLPEYIKKNNNNNNNNAQRQFKIETCEKNMQVNFIVIVLL